MKCAKGAEVDFASAGWGCKGRKIKADYYPQTPKDLFLKV